MYFLRKIVETSEDEILYSDLAIYKHNKYDRLYRKTFYSLNYICDNMKLYMTNSFSDIIELREIVYKHCCEWFDVYDEQLNKININKNYVEI